jgi:hypothetical protein
MSDNKPDEKINNPLGKITPIHTLESDLASAVMDNNYGKNIIKIVTDPTKNSTFGTNLNKEEGGDNKKDLFTKKNVLISLGSVFIILSILTILYVLYKAKNVESDAIKLQEKNLLLLSGEGLLNPNQPIIKYSDLLNSEVLQSNDFSKLNRPEIILEINKIRTLLINNKTLPNNNIGINSNLNIRQLFEKINYSGEENLLRSFGNNFAFGLSTNANSQLETYLLIEIDNFDLAFKSILDWEKYTPFDLKDLFIGNNEILNINVISTSTFSSTSTPTIKKYLKNNTDMFVDRVLKNYDIREYVNNENNINIIYGFINNKFLLITSGESSFLDIKNRLLKENIPR